MTKRSSSPAKPHARKRAARAASIDPDREWADGIWEQMLASCHPLQRDAVTDPARRYSYLVGRGGSKTTSFRVRGVRRLTKNTGAKVLYFASTRPRAKDLMWTPLKALLQKLGMAAGRDVIYNETELRCTIVRTGSTYQLSGLKDIADADKWRGETFDEVQFDECGAIKPELINYTVFQVIGPRVRCLGLGGTPGHNRRGLFYDATRRGSTKHRPYNERGKYPDFHGYSSHHWDLEDVLKVPGAAKKYPALAELWEEALIEKRDNQWSDDNPIWRREYRAEWAADDTLRVFGSFRAHHEDGTPCNVWDPFEGKGLIEGVAGLKIAVAKLKQMFPEFTDWRFVVPKDMGHKDPFACNVLMFSPHDVKRRKWQVMSYEKIGLHAKPIAELLIGEKQIDTFIKTGEFPITGQYGGVFGVIGWPDDMVFDSDHATIAELQNVYGIKTEKADKKPEYKKGAIELVNGEFTDGRFFVLLDSPMHEQLEQLQWKEQPNGTLIEDPAQANHSTDTAVYGNQAVATLFTSGRVTTDAKPQSPQNYADPMGLGPGIGTDDQADDEEALLAPSEWSEDDEDWP